MIATALLEQPCNKSDNINKIVTSCQQLVPNLLTTCNKPRANKTCWRFVCRLATSCKIFTCVAHHPSITGQDRPFSRNFDEIWIIVRELGFFCSSYLFDNKSLYIELFKWLNHILKIKKITKLSQHYLWVN